MEFTTISNTDLYVSRIGLGTWAMGGWLWGGSDKKNCIRTIYKALDNGINLIDTAPVYGFGISEEIVGEAVKQTSMRNEIVIATKAGLEWIDGKVYRNSTKDRLLKEVDDSLRRLKTSYIDLYQVHWPDPLVPIEEVAQVMSFLLKDGKIRAVGVSNYSPDQMDIFRTESTINSSQPPYNLFERGIEEDVFPYCTKNSISMLLYGALCRGMLSGKLSIDTVFKGDDLRNFDPKFEEKVYQDYLSTVSDLDDFSKKYYNKNVLELSVRWVLDRARNDITLWGARDPKQLDSVKDIFGWKIKEESFKEIDEIVNKYVKNPIGPEFMAPGARPSC